MASEELAGLLARLEVECRAGLEDLEDLSKRLPPLSPATLNLYLERGDFPVLLLTIALAEQGRVPDLSQIPALLSPSRDRATLEALCRLACNWYPREVLELALKLLLAEDSEQAKAGFVLFAVACALCPAEEVRRAVEMCLEVLRGKGDDGRILGLCTQAYSYSLKEADSTTTSVCISDLFPKIEALAGNSAHFLPFLPILVQNPSILAEYRSFLEAQATKDLLCPLNDTRTGAVAWLKVLLPQSNEGIYESFFDMYQTLENYSRHLVQSIWEKRFPSLTEPFNAELLSLLLRRVRAHENPAVKKTLLKLVLKAKLPQLSEVLEEVMQLVGDSSIFGDAPRHAGFSRFAATLPKYMRQFLTTAKDQPAALRRYIGSVRKYVEHQAGFYNCVMSLQGVVPPVFVTSECVRDMKAMLQWHFTNITPVQRRHICTVFSSLVQYRTADCDPVTLLDLLSLFPTDLLPLGLLFQVGEMKPLVEGWTKQHIQGKEEGVAAERVALALSLTRDWELCIGDLLQGPLRFLPTLYSSVYLSESHVSAAFKYGASVCTCLLPIASATVKASLEAFFLSAAPQFVSYLLLQAGAFSTSSEYLSALLPQTKKILKATIRASSVPAVSSILLQFMNELRKCEGRDLYRTLSIVTWIYAGLKAAPKSLRKDEDAVRVARLVWGLEERKAGEEQKLALSLTVLKWKLVKVCFSPQIYALIAPQLPDLLDISSSPMKKTAFKVLKKALHTDFVNHRLNIVLECKLDLSVRLLRCFYNFALHPILLERPEHRASFQQLLSELIETGKERWQFLRGVTLHLVEALQKRGELLRCFVQQVVELAVCMELRSSDSDLYYPELFVYLKLPTAAWFPTAASATGHMSQFVVLSYLHQSGGEYVRELVEVANGELDHKDSRKVDMPNSPSLRRKIALSQLLVTLAPFFPATDQDFVTQSVKVWLRILQSPISSYVRFYLEKLIVHLGLQSGNAVKAQLCPILKDINCKAQFGASVIFIAGALIVKGAEYAVFLPLITSYLVSNVALLRRTAHFVIMHYRTQRGDLEGCSESLQRVLGFMQVNSECTRMQTSLSREFADYCRLGEVGLAVVAQAQLNEFGSFVPDPILDRIDSVTAELMSESRGEDFSLRIDEFWLLEASKHSLTSSSANYQRKINQTIALESTYRGEHQRHGLIILASYVKSPHTLAGLTRTGEVFAAKKLLYSDPRLVESLEFKQMAVTAEKWMPMIHIPLEGVVEFLERRKRNGYKVLALEEKGTGAGSVPQAAVVIAVEAGEEVPLEVAALLDGSLAFQLPGRQFAALSTHISASLWIWEYTRQNYLS